MLVTGTRETAQQGALGEAVGAWGAVKGLQMQEPALWEGDVGRGVRWGWSEEGRRGDACGLSLSPQPRARREE